MNQRLFQVFTRPPGDRFKAELPLPVVRKQVRGSSEQQLEAGLSQASSVRRDTQTLDSTFMSGVKLKDDSQSGLRRRGEEEEGLRGEAVQGKGDEELSTYLLEPHMKHKEE